MDIGGDNIDNAADKIGLLLANMGNISSNMVKAIDLRNNYIGFIYDYITFPFLWSKKNYLVSFYINYFTYK